MEEKTPFIFAEIRQTTKQQKFDSFQTDLEKSTFKTASFRATFLSSNRRFFHFLLF